MRYCNWYSMSCLVTESSTGDGDHIPSKVEEPLVAPALAEMVGVVIADADAVTGVEFFEEPRDTAVEVGVLVVLSMALVNV